MQLYKGKLTLLVCILLSGAFSARALLADFTVSATVGCAPLYISFTNLSSGASSYDWNFGDPSPHSTVTSPTHTYSNPGSYTVILTAYSSTGTSTTKSYTINVYAAPVVYFRAVDTISCLCNAVSFIDSSVLNSPGSGTYYWQFGTGDVSTTRNPSYRYCTSYPVGYTVILKATNSAGCFSSLSKTYYLHVFDPPSATFSSDKTVICGLSGTVNFTSSVSGSPSPYTYDWDFGDGTTHGTTAAPTHSYSSPTYRSYNVTLVVTSNAGCKDTVTVNNYITLSHVAASFTISPASGSGCPNEYVIATNTSAPVFDSTAWQWGDGSVDNTDIAGHLYASAGTYTLKLITKIGACLDSTTKTITIHPLPVIKFGASPLTPCPAPVTINFTDSSSGLTSHLWKFGDSTTSTLANPSHNYTRDTFFDVTLVGTNSYGCMDSLTKTTYIKIYDLKLATLGNFLTDSVGGCTPFTVHFSFNKYYVDPRSGPVPYPYGTASISWDLGDGTTSASPTPIHTYSTYGNYKVMLTVTTVNGCTVTDSILVRVGTIPTAGFYVLNTNACVDQRVTFVNTSVGADWFKWMFQVGSSTYTYDTSNVVYRYSDSGWFNVTLIAVKNGCPDTLTKTHYMRINLPKAGFVYSYVCDSLKKISFVDTSQGETSREWDFGDGSPHSSLKYPFHIFPGFGSYNIKLIVSDSNTGCIDTATISLYTYNPILNFVASDTAVCLNTPVTFVSSVSGITVQKYNWIFDDTTAILDTTDIYTYTFKTVGYHNVKFTILDFRSCIDTFSRRHYIGIAKPTVDFVGTPTTGCPPQFVYFTDRSSDITGVHASSLAWDFGDSTYGTGSTPTHLYAKVGSYYVKLKVTDNVGCSDSTVKTGYIQIHKPVANFFATPVNACPDNPVSFINTSLGLPLTYLWRFGDGYTSTDLSPTHTYTATGSYTVTLIITDTSGCKDSIIKINYIRVFAKPKAAFTLDDSFSICPPLIVNFTNHSTGAVSYTWDFGDPTAGPPSTVTSPSWTYVNPNIYTITLVAYNFSGCTDTARDSVRLLGYKGAFHYSPLRGCAPLTVNFDVKVKGVPYFIYDFDDGTTLKTSSLTATHTYTAPGPKVPKLIMTDNAGCSSESIGLDTVFVDGVYHGFFVKPYPTCDSGTIQLIDTSRGVYSAIIKRKWYFHDGATSNVFNPYHTYHGPGVYSVILIDSTTSGCLDSFKSNVTFYNLPEIYAGADTTICLGDAATLSPTGGLVYTWSPAATLSCSTCYNPLATPTTKTVYTVIGTDIHGCKNTDSVTVSIKIKTASGVHGSGEICQGEFLQLHDSSGIYSVYKWIPPYGLNDPHSANPIANPDTSVVYLAIAQQAGCIPDTQYVNVIVHPRPVLNLGPDKQIIAGDGVLITAVGTNLYKLLWRPAESLSCDTCLSATATPKDKKTIYTVSATSDFGCQDSANITIFVVCEQSQVFMPNTFTPNGDGQNDIFYPRGKGLRIIKSFRIYSRWGQLVFDKENMNTNQKENGWDGTFKGEKLTPDVFVYIVDAICDTGEPMTWKGDIAIIR